MKLDEFHLHEALDRTHVLLSAFADHVAEHPFIRQDRELRRMANRLVDQMSDLYQAIGQRGGRKL